MTRITAGNMFDQDRLTWDRIRLALTLVQAIGIAIHEMNVSEKFYKPNKDSASSAERSASRQWSSTIVEALHP
jgi:hypothetical protein